METIITSTDELLKMVRDGLFFNFCVCFAVNNGYRDAIKEKKEVKFTIGDYNVEFNHDKMCFILSHNIYFARIICASYHGVEFVGDSEEEVISELLAEATKELKLT